MAKVAVVRGVEVKARVAVVTGRAAEVMAKVAVVRGVEAKASVAVEVPMATMPTA